jgi:hypothetical protein
LNAGPKRKSSEVTTMIRFKKDVFLISLSVFFCLGTRGAMAQTRSGVTVGHLNFDSPEAWALKRFTSATIMSGLQPPEMPVEERRIGSISLGLESGWLPALSAEQARVGFSGHKEEDINKAPVMVRPIVRVGLPWQFSLAAAAPPPFRVFGVTPRLLALALERPILERERWRLGWRASGQLGSVKAAFTCPHRALGFPAGSANNPSGCVAESNDVASLRYIGTELQFAYSIPQLPKLQPHASFGVNLIDGRFRVDAPLQDRVDRSRLWTRGNTFSGSAGVSYLLSKRVALTIDAFYSPLGVQRSATAGHTNDGLFNVRALLSYNLR